MSRTIRRKNVALDNWCKDKPYIFYSDMYEANFISKKCRQIQNIRFRAQNKQILRQAKSQNNYDLPFVVYKKTAAWACD